MTIWFACCIFLSTSYIIILFQFVFRCLSRRLMLSVFEFIFVTIFLSRVLLSVFLSLFGHSVNFLTLKSVSSVLF